MLEGRSTVIDREGLFETGRLKVTALGPRIGIGTVWWLGGPSTAEPFASPEGNKSGLAGPGP